MRDKLFQIIVVIISGLLIIKLFELQIINNNSSQILQRASIQKVYDFPERGYIYDRNKKLIVYNEPYYDLMIIPKDIKISDSLLISKEINLTSRDFLDRFNKAKKYSNVKPSSLVVFLFKKNLKENITFKLLQIFLDIQAK